MTRRANELDGKTWTRHSISVWRDIAKTREEQRLGHPASFPVELVRRLIECFLPPEGRLVLDPFAGSGSTLVAAQSMGKEAIGVELSPAFAAAARERLEAKAEGANAGGAPATRGRRRGAKVICDDARHLLRHVAPDSVDLVITSPPYWDILTRRRSADGKAIRHYGPAPEDLGKVRDYERFLDEMADVFGQVYQVLRSGRYCVVVVMDVRKGPRFYPLHADLAARLVKLGFIHDDIIIWDRRQEYNSLRPLGFPAVFRVNKVHEYVLVFQKPKEGSLSGRAVARPARAESARRQLQAGRKTHKKRGGGSVL